MGKYDDIIALSRPVSKTHPPMPRSERAAQFSSFAALSGYEDAVEESARLTETRSRRWTRRSARSRRISTRGRRR